MKDKRKLELHEQMYGPHFNERCALKAVALMENEDGTRGYSPFFNFNDYGI